MMGYRKVAKVLKGIILIYACFVTVTCASYNGSTDSMDNTTDCGPVPNITNGFVELNDDENTLYGALAYVVCDSGYESNTAVLTCLNTGDWEDWETFANCEPKDCGSPPTIDDGEIVLRDTANTTYGAVANITCHEGYMTSASNISCLDTGYWRDNVTCTGCGVVPSLENGEVTLVDSTNISYGAVANVTCYPGYEARVANITCLSSGVWESNVTCLPVECNISPSVLHGNGSIALIDGESSYGAQATVTCEPHYTAVSINAACLDSIDLETVTNATSAINATLLNCFIAAMSNPLNSTCLESINWEIAMNFTSAVNVTSLNCYIAAMSNPLNITCLESGDWRNVFCIPIVCGPVPIITHGQLIPLGSTNISPLGAVANLTCDIGYVASTPNISCLENFQWEDIATCSIVECISVPSVPHGSIDLVGDNTSYGAIAFVTCDTAYTPSTPNITCLESGEWENATCDLTVIECSSAPSLPHGSIDLVGNDTSHGAIAFVTCDTAYTPSTPNITCLESGEWENATCDVTVTECSSVPSVPHGRIDLVGNDTSHGAIAFVTCDSEYTARKPNITCQESGEWENSTCDLPGCGVVPNIENGEVTLVDSANISYGAVANVTCYPGYEASAANITCLSSGVWENNATCLPVECNISPSVLYGNGSIALIDGESSYGAQAAVTCEPNYTAVSINTTCLDSINLETITNATSAINATLLNCFIAALSNPLNSTCLESINWEIVMNVTSTINITSLNCLIEAMSNPLNITCLESGDWQNVFCIPIVCGPVPIITNGQLIPLDSANISPLGAVANLTCDMGYVASTPNISCLENFQWEDSATCSIVECSSVPSLPHGSIDLVGNDTSYGTKAFVTCDTAYTASTPNITCLESGEWENATCELTGCAAVPSIPNGIVYDETGVSIGAVAYFTCNAGYNNTIQQVTCLADGNWENQTCYPIDCGALTGNISEGTIELMDPSNTSYGALAVVRCNEGFEAVPLTVDCTATGEWGEASCDPIDCGDPQNIQYGIVTLVDTSDTAYGAEAMLQCEAGFDESITVLLCEETGDWQNATCSPKDCGEVPEIENGNIVLVDDNNSTYRAQASVNCAAGYSADKSNITCLASGNWDDNVTCTMNECDVNNVPSIENGEVILDTNSNQSTSVANVSCFNGFAATSPVVACMEQGVWQDDVTCVPYALGTVRVETGQEITTAQHTAYFKCVFTIVDGLKYRIKWYINGYEFFDTGVLTSAQASVSVLTDNMLTNVEQQFFGTQVSCSAVVFDGAGTTELENETSTDLVPLQVSTNDITMTRGKEVTFTVFLSVPFGCTIGSQICYLRFVLYDPNDSYNCYDSSMAVVHSDTCGGKIDGATHGTVGHVTTTGTITNITITTKNNRWYRLRWYFPLVLKLAAVGNSKSFWNTPSTSITVRVNENYLTKYRGCYSFVDPYIYTFDRRWYSMQILENFVMLRHKTLPIEVQTVTAPCNRWATCSCAVTVRAGGDVFSINHCSNDHLTSYLSARDGIMKVYRLWSTYYQIILPNGMQVFVYIMSYFNYMMNVYIVPTPSDFEQTEGLCGNFNGDFSDDTILRGSTDPDPYEAYYGDWGWWSYYFYPHAFAYSWGLQLTGRSYESLQDPNVYENVDVWDSNKKLCVCPNANSGSSYEAWCSADEEATCTQQVWRWGTLIGATTRQTRDVDGNVRHIHRSDKDTARRLVKITNKWKESRQHHAALRKKRQVNNNTTITMEEAEQMCRDKLGECVSFSNKDNVSEQAESNDTLNNCIRDTAESGDTDWVETHCDAFTQKVTVELDKDVEFAENNTDLVNNIKESSCPGNCSGHGQCVNQTCICVEDFATDLCLLNITLGPLIEELADEGICDVSTGSACNYILIVGNGFIDTATCNLTVYLAGQDGIFNLTDTYEINCTYLNYNELYALIPDTNVTNTTTEIAKMVGVSVSNDGTHYGAQQTVVILDTTCQQTETNADGETIVTLKAGYCYIEATCYTSGTYLAGSSCAKCDTSQSLFIWTDACNIVDDTNKNNLIVIMSSVGSAIFVVAVALVLVIYFNMKAKKKRKLTPLVDLSLGPSKMRFWFRKGSDVAIVQHHLPPTKGRKMAAASSSAAAAAEYMSDDDEIM